jgi:Flp pilus assembly protein TadD
MGNKISAADKTNAQATNNKTLRLVFVLLIIIFTFILYGNTINNLYSLDDYIIKGNNSSLLKDGISSIGEIFTTTYTSVNTDGGVGEPEVTYGYRPIVRTVYALEYSLLKIFGFDPMQNPRAAAKAGHIVNILIYLALVLVLFRVLQRIFKNYSIWFPFVIILLFMAHPVHTEVVASLKNRDEMLSMLFSLFTMLLLFKYYDKKKIIYLLIGLFCYVLAFLSKPTALAFLLIYPLTFYFFTDMKLKKIGIVFGWLLLMVVIGGIMPFWFLEQSRNLSMVDNPLSFTDNIWYFVGTGMYGLGYYVRLLVFPHPLLYYYGYDVIPMVNLSNGWVILSIIFYVGIFIIALRKFKEKHVISYAILFYLISIAMFSNIFKPVPGIIGERFLLIPSLGFAMIITWLIFKLFKAEPQAQHNKASRIFFVMVLTVLILAPYTYKTIQRNTHWFTGQSLYKQDMPFLENSVKAHDLMGTSIMKKVELELSKQVNVAKFLMPDIQKALNHYKRAVEIWPGHASSYRNMAMIYNHPRIMEHLVAKGDTAMAIEWKNNAISNFKKAIELNPEDGKALFNLGLAYESVGTVDSAIYYYEECIRQKPDIINPRSRLADLYFSIGNSSKAIELNREIIYRHPGEALPYVSFGNYYMVMGDTLKAVESYKEAAKRNARPEVYSFLGQYYMQKGDQENAEFYRNKYMEAMGQPIR